VELTKALYWFDGPATYLFQAAEKHVSRIARRLSKSETYSFLNHNRSCSAIKTLLRRDRMASFLTHNFSSQGEKGRFSHPDEQENVWLAATKRIVSDRARNAPLLHLKFRDARMLMGQKANRIKSNDRCLRCNSATSGLNGPILLESLLGCC